MSNNLKDFIEDNRRSFDDETPSLQSWSRIADEMDRRSKRKSPIMPGLLKWSAAAAVFFIVTTGVYFFVNRKNGEQRNETSVAKANSNDLNALSPEFAALAKKIEQTIDLRQQELKQVTADQPDVYDQFTQDLAALDSAYRVLRTQAARTTNRELLLHAMMQNLQLQAQLLNKQLQVFQEYKNNKTDNHEKDDYRPL